MTGTNESASHRLRVVVTGANGCIGTYLVPALKSCGCEVCEINSDEEAKALPPDARFDVFVNLAWLGSRGAQRGDYGLQLKMVRTALDYYGLALRLGCRRFVCPGTIGELMVELPECKGIHSQNFVYVNAKGFLRRLLRAVERPDACRVIWARLGNLYGVGDSGNLLNWMLTRILAGEEASFGPARQPYEFVAIEDCARALSALATADELGHDCYYVGVGEPRMLQDLLLEAGRIAGREDLVAIGRRPDDGTRYRAEWFDISPLTADTGFRPSVPFADGVKQLVSSLQKGGTP